MKTWLLDLFWGVSLLKGMKICLRVYSISSGLKWVAQMKHFPATIRPPGTVTRGNSLGRELGEKTRDRVNSVNSVSFRPKTRWENKNLDRTQWTRWNNSVRYSVRICEYSVTFRLTRRDLSRTRYSVRFAKPTRWVFRSSPSPCVRGYYWSLPIRILRIGLKLCKS